MAWDEGGWHYSADADVVGPRTAQYVFVLDALNFCFWPSEGWVGALPSTRVRLALHPPVAAPRSYEYDSLAVGLRRVLEADPHAFDAERLAKCDESTVARWMGREDACLLDERAAKIREVRPTAAARARPRGKPTPDNRDQCA